MTGIIEPVKGIELIDLALYLKEEQILVLADFHIGQEDALVKQGVLIPKFHFRDLVKRLEHIFETLRDNDRQVKYIIINGDLKHEFGRISDEEWRNTLKVIDFLSRHCEKIIMTKGNHDTILGPIADKRKVLFVDHFIDNDKLICHGNTVPDIPKDIKTIIIGHEHPAAGLYDELRLETYKCFLVGKYKRKNLIVQPAMNPLSRGSDMTHHKPHSKFLQHSLDSFKVFIVADKVYEFGKLSKLAKH
ncbi:metallophosphoesterase [Candidatus Woesearchaeota archaeon]|nr:metallophosphoesterase [Candidatus Woesearchaeota archaeon]